ncbi:MAG: acyl-ACP--UDP-N-acetylglucosamine O-acyltransferase [Gammaproteobacteria bacterium]|nr:acyl-ACP--UDP-N-acetylglucosamine O-acyltransferase [Gammaproteobacteria bacterium]
MIDKLAVVDQHARIADSADIGPYSCIGADVVIGENTVIGPHVVIKGPTTIGANNRIFQFSSIGEDPQDKKYAQERTELLIGDHNVIREYCTINRGTVQDNKITRIGHHNLFMAYTHIAHDCVIGSQVVMSNGASLAGHVRLGDHVVLGGFSLVHQFTHIGDYCFSAMGSAVSQDIPPYIMVAGNPTKPHSINIVGLERHGFSLDVINEIRRAYKIIYKSGLKLGDAIAVLSDMTHECPEIQCMVDFLRQSNRGIIR